MLKCSEGAQKDFEACLLLISTQDKHINIQHHTQKEKDLEWEKREREMVVWRRISCSAVRRQII